MTMFKKGDLVRIINDDYAMDTPSHIVEYKKGELYNVYEDKPSNYPLLRVFDPRMSGGFGVLYPNNVEKVEKGENTTTKFKIGDVIENVDSGWQDKRIVDITDDDYIVDVLDRDGVPSTTTDFSIDYIDKYYQLKDEHSEDEHSEETDEQSEEKQATYTYSIYRTDIDDFEEFKCIVSEKRTTTWLSLTDIDGNKYDIRAEVVTSIYIVKEGE